MLLLTGSRSSFTNFVGAFSMALGQPPQQTRNRLSLIATRGAVVRFTFWVFITGQFIAVLMYLAGSFAKAVGQLPQQKLCFSPFTVRVTVLSVTANALPLTGQVASLT